MMFLAGFIAAILGTIGGVTAMLLLEGMIDNSIDGWGRRKVVQLSITAFVCIVLTGAITLATQPLLPDSSRGMGFVFGLFATIVAMSIYANVKRSRRRVQ